MRIIASVGTGSLPRAGRIVSAGQVWAMVCAMVEARRTRRILAEMDNRLLADIGVGPGEAQMEARRPFWDIETLRR